MSTDPRWEPVDRFLQTALAPADPALDAALAASAAAGLPDIQVTATQGKLLMLLAQVTGARRVLEVGTLGGYSTIWLARGVGPGGSVTTIEVDRHHAEVARRNLDNAQLAATVDVRVGAALEVLATLAEQGVEPYDLIFIDADKRNNPGYVQWALGLTRPGAVIVVDNVVRDGRVADASSDDPDVRGTREVIGLLGAHPQLDATAIQTVGSKGYDGFALAVVRAG